MVFVRKRISIDEFEVFIQQPENADKLFEYIAGELYEVPSNPYVSAIASLINFFILQFIRENDIKGYVTGEAGGYMVSGERYAPDVAFISSIKQATLAETGYNPAPPDLAVEVMSPNDDNNKLRAKVFNYTLAGTVVWVVNPKAHTVEVYVPGQPMQTYTVDDVLNGGDVLPKFRLPVKEIFPPKADS